MNLYDSYSMDQICMKYISFDMFDRKYVGVCGIDIPYFRSSI